MPWSLISTSQPLANTETWAFALGALKAMVGFARPFRPTYAGANVGHPSPNEVDCATFSRVPQKRNCSLRFSQPVSDPD
jgi:hypothetical protein